MNRPNFQRGDLLAKQKQIDVAVAVSRQRFAARLADGAERGKRLYRLQERIKFGLNRMHAVSPYDLT
ncbi:MAG: hypothetical protein R2881_02380 [Eubacteriales bacterium]